MSKAIVFSLLCSGALVLLLTPRAYTNSVQKLKTREDQVREQMLQITKELGTTCTECHSVSNFKDGSKEAFKVAAKHLKIVSLLRDNGFDGKAGPEATCFMCHRGQMKPAYKQK